MIPAMEPLSAVGLASNLIQFVDFSTKVIVGARQLYKSTNGTLDESTEIKDVTERLRELTTQLMRSPDKDISEISSYCQHISEELIDILETLELPSETRNRTWHAFRVALRAMRKENRIKDLDARLERLQSQLNTRLLLLVNENISQQLNSLRKGHSELVANTTVRLQDVKDELIHAIDSELEAFEESKQERKRLAKEEKNFEKTVQNGILQGLSAFFTSYTNDKRSSLQQDDFEKREEESQNLRERRALRTIEPLSTIDDHLKDFAEEAKEVARKQEILRSLCYDELRDRFGNVSKPHTKTFEWIFSNERLRFEEWLRSTSSLYWVSGQPGSGKSTLMKFIYDDIRTRRYLRDWAGDDKLIIAQHFFWIGGNKMQTSQQGLIQSILYQVLHQHPQAIPAVCQERWQGLEADFEPWNLSSLEICIRRLSAQAPEIGKVCLFIDGLDEYRSNHNDSSNRKHDGLLEILSILSACARFKLCISSRPWNVFVHAYGGLKHKLFMEEQTKDDIRRFVADKLGKDQYIQGLMRQGGGDPQYNIIEQVIDKAEGVFIWVYFVVDLLLDAEQNADTLNDLSHKINDYPRGLEGLFDRIMGNIQEGFYQDSAKILTICMEAEHPQPLILYHFLDKDWQGDETYSLLKVTPFQSDAELEALLEAHRRRLNARCRGFVKVTVSSQDEEFTKFKVCFFHRTVRDFMDVRQDWLKEKAGERFDVRISLCRATLGLVKSWKYNDFFARDAPWMLPLVDELLLYAHDVEVRDGEASKTVKLLDELDRFLSEVSLAPMQGKHWSNARDLPDPCRDDVGENTFLGLATEAGLCSYVRLKLDQDESVLGRNRNGRPLLDYALRPHSASLVEVPRHHEINPELVQLLLEKGANPNETLHMHDSQTVWVNFLLHCYVRQPQSEDILVSLCKATQALLCAGANKSVKCSLKVSGAAVTSTKYKKMVNKDTVKVLTVKEVFERVYRDENLETLLLLLEEN